MAHAMNTMKGQSTSRPSDDPTRSMVLLIVRENLLSSIPGSILEHHYPTPSLLLAPEDFPCNRNVRYPPTHTQPIQSLTLGRLSLAANAKPLP